MTCCTGLALASALGLAACASDEIHRTADRRNALGTHAPVGEVAILRHLIGAEDGHIQMAAAHHGETVRVVEEGRAGLERYRLLAGIDEIPILLALSRRLRDIGRLDGATRKAVPERKAS